MNNLTENLDEFPEEYSDDHEMLDIINPEDLEPIEELEEPLDFEMMNPEELEEDEDEDY